MLKLKKFVIKNFTLRIFGKSIFSTEKTIVSIEQKSTPSLSVLIRNVYYIIIVLNGLYVIYTLLQPLLYPLLSPFF